jgi:hypothetical protein
MKFKIILTILFLSISAFSFANNKEENFLPINGKYVEKFETKNIVFNDIYKKFIKDYEKNFKLIIKDIEENNRKVDVSSKAIDSKIAQDIKNFKYQGDGKTSAIDERNRFLNKYVYDINRLSKLKTDFQEKKINQFLQDQIDNYKLILKDTIQEYDLSSEEEDFISETSKKMLEILIKKLKENESYSKTKLESLKKDLSKYKEIQNQYSEDLKNLNYKIDAEIFNLIWKDVRSNSKYPKIDE